MKKSRILILTLLMVFTILPVNTIAEGEDTTCPPDVSVYATKEQLMTEFVTYSEGENIGKPINNNIGKIVFGKKKNSDNTYSPQEWYILGKDEGIIDDQNNVINNTLIFATSQIDSNSYKFSNSGTNYNSSTIRGVLNDMVDENSDYFTNSEINLLNATPIPEDDYVRDKLYLLAAEGY